MAEEREPILKLGKKITDRVDVKLGMTKLDASSPEYYGLAAAITDEMAELALKMKIRVPVTLEQLTEISGMGREATEKLIEEMAQIGLVEYNWENPTHTKQYSLPPFVPGCAEFMNMNLDLVESHPQIAEFFYQMSRLPLEKITAMVPPGGAGIGMHVIPVEKAIPAQQKSVDVEHISHWLKKYDKYAIGACSCRRSMRIRGEGCGELEDELCIGVGDMATYSVETGKAPGYSTYEEVMALLQRCEDNGYVHQITNIDGENKIFAICNCALGSCYALRTSQLFNTPNMSRSAYSASVDPKNCVGCGKCVEVCPAGAAKLGQKLCTKDGPIVYPKQELPDDHKWGPEKWNENYRDDNTNANCYDSGTAPCKTACPAHIAVQGYINLAAQGKYMDALKLIKQDNPFPAVCGSICNRYCEDACTRGSVDSPVAIDEIKRFIAERELHAETRYIPEKRYHRGSCQGYSEKIAVIGAGPAGLSCAYYLAEMGYENVTVFDRNKTPGGMLTMGIPSFRLEKNVVKAEIDILKEMGVKFKCGVNVGEDVTIAELRKKGFKGFYVAIGAQKSAPIGVTGEELPGVLGGVDFLRQVNSGEKPAVGAAVAVIGGGNVSIDVARAALRLGAKHVYLVYRRSRDEIKASDDEVEEALNEGVELKLLRAPAEIIADKNGKTAELKLEIMELGEADASGRKKPVGTGKFETLKVKTVIGAIGQRVDWGKLVLGTDLVTTKKGTAVCDPVTYQTGEPDIFVGGDVVTGPKFAIDAIAAGREGATSLHRFVHPGQSLTMARNRREFKEMDKANAAVPVGCFDAPARQKPVYDAKKAKSFSNDRKAFTEEQVKAEASRCLGCGATVVDTNRCIGCGLCTTRCNFDAIHLTRTCPDASRMWKTEDKMKAILPYTVKREIKIKQANRKKK